MKRDWLRQMGLDGEVIDSIMAENGRDIKVALERQEELAKAQGASSGESTAEDVDALKAEISALREQHEAIIAGMKLDWALESALSSYGAKNPMIVRAALDMSLISCAEGKIQGLKEQIEELIKAEPYLFETKPREGFQPVKISFANPHGEAAEPDDRFFSAFSHAASLTENE